MLKNYNSALNKLQYQLKDLEIDYQKLVIAEQKENFLLDAAIKFVQWVAVIEKGKIYKERMILAEEQLKKLRDRFKENLIDKIDILRSEDEIKILEQTIINLYASRASLNIELSHLANDPEILNTDPSFDLYEQSILPDKKTTEKKLCENTRIISSLNKQNEQLKSAWGFYQESSKPDLKLILATSFTEGDSKFGEALFPWKPEVSIGLDFSMPFANKENRKELEKKDLELKIISLEIENIKLALRSELNQHYSNYQQLLNILEINRDLIKSSKEKTSELVKLYNLGRGDLFYVIQSRDSEADVRLQYIENATYYQILKLQIKALLDELL